MRIGIMSGAPGGICGPDTNLEAFVEFAQRVEQLGLSTLWMAHLNTLDAISTLGLTGSRTRRLEFGSAVVPSYSRHPLAMAQEALTAGVASGGRFTLGIGLSHKFVIEGMYGLSYARPARHMAEYLEVLGPLLRGEAVDFAGTEFRVKASVEVPDAPRVPLLVAALGERMLRIAGRLADGTLPWMCGPETLRSHIVPTIRKAAREAGRTEPRIVPGLPIVLTNDPDGARSYIASAYQVYGSVPSYRAMLDREGAKGPADVALVGDEPALRSALEELRDLGVTDFNAAIVPVDAGAAERTLGFLASFS